VLNRDHLTIGRDSSSDVFVDDPEVSRHHADLVRRGRDWFIVDAGSSNGTSVNGEKVREMTLRPGDCISLGGVELTLRAGSDSRSSYDSGPGPRTASRSSRASRASRKRELIDIRISRRILWVGTAAYPLQNIARAQTIEIQRDRRAALRRYLKALVLCVFLGAAATVAIKLAPRLSSVRGSNALLHAAAGLLVLALALMAISTVRLIIVLLARTYYALVIETSGTPQTALISDNETEVSQIVGLIMDAIDDPGVELNTTIENHNNYNFGGNQINQSGSARSGDIRMVQK
jgi:Family of unknown function (DUF6232)/FHA domain